MSTDDPIATAVTFLATKEGEFNAAKDLFFDLCAERVRDGEDTAETIADRAPYSAVTIRNELRKRDVTPLRPGRKPRQTGDRVE